jgi:hypothetical protein
MLLAITGTVCVVALWMTANLFIFGMTIDGRLEDAKSVTSAALIALTLASLSIAAIWRF